MATLTKPKTIIALGHNNTFRLLAYRLRLQVGIHPVQRIAADVPSGAFFRAAGEPRHKGLAVNRQWHDEHLYFGWFTEASSTCPDWFMNPLNCRTFLDANHPWWKIPDFKPDIGDIKTVWEASRFDWVIGFAQEA